MTPITCVSLLRRYAGHGETKLGDTFERSTHIVRKVVPCLHAMPPALRRALRAVEGGEEHEGVWGSAQRFWGAGCTGV